MEVEVGDTVRAGDSLFFDKQMPEVKFVAPVSGEVIAINRGEKRSIVEVVILADREQQYRSMDTPDLERASRAELMDFLAASGGWTLIRQRPFNVLATPGKAPRDIFISTFDTGPLAPDLSLVVEGNEAAFQKGIDVLSRLTDGRVHLGLDARQETAPAAAFVNAANAETYFFKGPHPAGNVGVQIHHIAPVSGAAPVWTLGVQEVITLGKLFSEGKFDGSRVVALTGDQLNEAHYVKTFVGANVGELVAGNLKQSKVRIISGDVLSGQQKSVEGFMNMYDDQLTVIEEGDHYELFGWLLALKPRPSVSRTYLNFLFPIVVNDVEEMEGLGILELVEEDVALCEFACVSKQPLQKILREGLDALREQG